MTDLIVLPGIIVSVSLWNSIDTLKHIILRGFHSDIEQTLYIPLIQLCVLVVCGLFIYPSFDRPS